MSNEQTSDKAQKNSLEAKAEKIHQAIKGYSEDEQNIFLEATEGCILRGITDIDEIIKISNQVVNKMKEQQDESE